MNKAFKKEIEIEAKKYAELMMLCYPMEREDYEKAFMKGVTASHEYTQQFSQWTTAKPDFKEECVLVAANLIKGEWNHEVYEMKKLYDGDNWYMGILTGDGEEWGDISDLTADKYLILPKHT